MVGTKTREGRAERWRFFNVVAAVILALSIVQVVAIADASAQVTKVPAKKISKVVAKTSKPAQPVDNQEEADKLNAKWLADHNAAEAAATAAGPTSPAAIPAAPAAPVVGEEDKYL